ncbi:GNAT family N-acetyltransferase [Alteribacter populi]|uniref:GNAT family N-acetyltransferase n=1 Tax=Alteribacter populi TaxID=2011011 RepID=UPI000BBA5D5A|nr:GNAT family N-acetyltransferase [Alteribacter populi]
MEIRILKPSDAQKYRELRLEALQTSPEAFASTFEEEKAYSIETYADRFESEHSFNFAAFAEEDNLVGMVTLVRANKEKLKHRATILGMYVTPDKRGEGIGKRLITEAIDKAKAHGGIEQIYLHVVTTNESAVKLYSSIGFTSFGTERHALKSADTYYDEELMVLFLE